MTLACAIPTNKHRSLWAIHALAAHLQAKGETPRIDQEAITDLIADTLHLCVTEQLIDEERIQELLNAAWVNFTEEHRSEH